MNIENVCIIAWQVGPIESGVLDSRCGRGCVPFMEGRNTLTHRYCAYVNCITITFLPNSGDNVRAAFFCSLYSCFFCIFGTPCRCDLSPKSWPACTLSYSSHDQCPMSTKSYTILCNLCGKTKDAKIWESGQNHNLLEISIGSSVNQPDPSTDSASKSQLP